MLWIFHHVHCINDIDSWTGNGNLFHHLFGTFQIQCFFFVILTGPIMGSIQLVSGRWGVINSRIDFRYDYDHTILGKSLET